MKNPKIQLHYKLKAARFTLAVMFIMCLLCVNFASALFPSATINDKLKGGLVITPPAQNYPAISIKTWFGLPLISSDLEDIVLLDHTQVCSDNCYSTMQIKTYQESPIIDDIKFYTLSLDANGDETDRKEQAIRDYKIYIQTGTENVNVKDYGEVCNSHNELNGTISKDCYYGETGTHSEEQPVWSEYNKEIEPAGTYNIKIVGNKKDTRTVDWVITTQSQEVTDLATWGGLGLSMDNYWKFNEAGGTTATDTAHLGNTLKAINGTFEAGKLNNALKVNKDAEDVGRVPYSLGNVTTVAFWIKNISSTGGYGVIYGDGTDSDGKWGIGVHPSNGRMTISCGNGDGAFADSGGAGDVWEFVVVEINGIGKNRTVWINNAITIAAPCSAYAYTGSNIHLFGGSTASVASQLNKNTIVDDFRIYNGTMSTTERNAIYNSGNGAESSSGGSITINSPPDGNKSNSPNINFNCSATPGSPATLVNISLWTNLSTWGIKQTYWKVLNDKTGNSNWGTPMGGSIVNGSEGVFDGINDYINISRPLNFNYNKSITYSLWMKLGRDGTAQSASNTLIRTNVSYMYVRETTNIVYIRYDDGSARYSSYTLGNGDRNWHHIVGFYNGINMTNIYVDGILRDADNFPGAGNSAPTRLNLIGGGSAPQANFSGSIDEVRIYNTSLSASEITDIYNYGRGHIGSAPTTTGLVAYYDFNDAVDNNSTTSFFSQTLTPDGQYLWTGSACDSDGDCSMASENRTLLIDTIAPSITIYNPSNSISNGYSGQNLSLNVSITDTNLGNCWYEYQLVNKTFTCGKNTTFIQSSNKNIRVYANDTLGNLNYTDKSWVYNFADNGVTYSSPVISGDITTIIGNFSITTSPTTASLNYNSQNYTTSVLNYGNEYILINNLIVPNVTANTNISFYYNFLVGGSLIQTSQRNQTVQNIIVSNNCSAGKYSFMNISNFEEENLGNMNATVEYNIQLFNNNVQITQANGSSTNTDIEICTDKDISTTSAVLNMQLRYYNESYLYKTYNIQNDPVTSLPFKINLYYLNESIGNTFKINYVDFTYLTHPKAIIQIQRQYLSDDNYKVVEIPRIADNGEAQGSFNTKNVRYKLIIIENGTVIDIFNDVFPTCQSSILGTCNLNLRGSEVTSTTTSTDFTYTINQSGNNITLTYIIPSGTPRTVSLITNQDSRFLNNITTCNNTLFASGGTIICSYNKTIGDSIVDTQIAISGEDTLYGQIMVSEDLSSFFLLNNYVIAFFLLLSLILMFISSATVMLIVGVVGLLYLGIIFLIKGSSLTTIAASIMWLIIAIVLAIIKIAAKEEKT